MLSRVLLFSSLLLPVSVSAQLYKCQTDDKTTYQTEPCADSVQIDVSKFEVETSQALKRQKEHEQYLKSHPRKLTVGMSASEVTNAWGRPNKVNRSVYSSSVHEQWVYPSNRYAYLENGFLTSYSE